MKTKIACLFIVLTSACLHAGGSTQPRDPDAMPEGLAKSDWQSIRAAYEAGRHAFQPVEGGWQARNPGQQWTTQFDGRGFLARPRGGGWEWGLELQSYGFGNEQRNIGTEGRKAAMQAAGTRLSYQWDAAVREWFVNDQRGLEHGFTVQERPEETPNSKTQIPSPPLSLTLRTRGTLHPCVSTDAQSVLFQNAAGATVINYSGLKVWDADGKLLPSRFVMADSQLSTLNSQPVLRILVDERGARYPLTIDPVAQQAYLKPEFLDATQAGDEFGVSVAVSGDTVVVGARKEDSSTTGVNTIRNESATDAGAAYVFVRSGTTWTQQAYLKPAAVGTTQASDQFGWSVAIAGDTVIVGAPGEDSSTTGVNSAPNENALNAGSAFVFVRSGTTWSQQAYLKPAAVGVSQTGDSFGISVAVEGDTVVVGAYAEDSSTTGVNSTPNESASVAGAAYVFTRSGTTWSQQAYLKPAAVGTTQATDQFGWSVAVSGDTVAVSANGEDSSSTGVNSAANESASNAGAVFVFVRSGTTWSQQAYLKPAAVGTTQAGDEFGRSVFISGDTVIVGAPFEDSNTVGVNSTPNEGFLPDAGAAYVFTRSAGVWTQQAYLKPGNVGATQGGDLFGYSVSLSGDTAVIGAPLEDSSSTGVNGTHDESAANAGAAYVFTRSGAIWSQQAYVKPGAVGTTQAGDNFGISIAVSGDTAVIGSALEDSSAPRVNGTPNEGAADAGAAGVFERSGIAWTQHAYLKPDAGIGQAGDEFGRSVAVSGDTAVIGAPFEDSTTTGVNGTSNDDGDDCGAAYVFTRSAGVWTLQAFLKPAAIGTTQNGDQFGISVSVSGDTVVVGAHGEDSSTTGVNSTPNEFAFSSGAACVFVRNGTTWTQQAYLKPAAFGTSQAGDNFGISVSVSGDTVVVGAQEEDSGSTGVNSTPNEGSSRSGAAYVFARSGTVWTQQAYLKPAAVGFTQEFDHFGESVAVSGDTVVVGAPNEDSSSTGVNSVPNDLIVEFSGAAYVFTRSAGVWTQQAYLKPAAVGATQDRDLFGESVAVSGDTVVVGAPQEGSSSTGVNSTPNEGSVSAGAAYVFVRSGTTWTQQAYLKAGAVGFSQERDRFGASVAVSDDTVVVGANQEDSSTSIVNGTPNESATDAGAAYVFTRSGTRWFQRAYSKPAAVGTIQELDNFGESVAVSGDTVIIGSPREDSNTTGVNSIANESASNAGAAFVFTVNVPGIFVDQPAGTVLFTGVSSINCGEAPQGLSAAAKTFTIGKSGPGALAIASVSTVGGNAGDFTVNTTGMLTSVPSGGSTTFTVTFTPSALGSRATTLRIVSDDPFEGTFDIALTGLGLSFTTDTDGDGLNDASESQLAALGFDFQVSQPALVNTLFSSTAGLEPNLNAAGFFTPAQVQALHIDVPLIQRAPGTGLFTFTFGLQKSTTLAPGSFSPFPFTPAGTSINAAGKIEFQFTSPDNAAFFRLEPPP